MKILVAEDDPVTRLALKRLLTERGFAADVVADGEQAFRRLQERDPPRLAIVDWMMPGMNGVELCHKLRASGTLQRIHIIMLTGKSDSDDLVTALDAGADAYVRKPFNIDELHAQVRAAQRLIRLQEQLHEQVYADELTGISSRHGIQDFLCKAIADAAREGSTLSVALADIDRFKQINDTYGHLVGDAALRGVANLLGACLRPSDAVGRFGGDEFLIVLPGCPLNDAVQIAERVRRHVASKRVPTSAGPLAITLSFGVAGRSGASVVLDTLVSEADQALYRAKAGGRNLVGGPVEA